MKRNIIILLAAVLLSGLAVGSNAVEVTHTKGSYETPHVKWGRPAQSEPKKILVFVGTGSGIGRYPAELEQRYNIDYTPVYWAYSSWAEKGLPKLIGGEEGISRVEDLVRRNKYDAFIFWGCTPNSILAGARTAYLLIVQQIVRNNAGLLIVDAPADVQLLKEKNKIADPDAYFSNFKGMKRECYKIVNSRGALVTGFDAKSISKSFSYGSRQGLPYCEGWRDLYELRFADIYNTLAWIMQLPAGKSQVSLSGGKMTVTPDADGKMECFLAGEGDRFQFAKDMQVVKGKKYEFAVSPVPGNYLAGVIIRNDGKSVSFAQKYIKIERKATAPQIKLDKNLGYPGDKIEISAVWQGNAVLRLRDRFRRILAEEKLSGNQLKKTITLDGYLPHDTVVEVATIGKDGKDLDRAYKYLVQINERTNMFDVMAWGYQQCYLAALDINIRLRELGINELVQAYGGAYTPVEMLWIGRYGCTLHRPEMRSEKGCWSNPVELKKVLERFKGIKPYAPGWKRIMLMDEGPGQLGCLCVHCRKAYQDFLKRKYNTVDKLNAAWKSDFKTWDEVDVTHIKPKGDPQKEIRNYLQKSFRYPGYSHIAGSWKVKNPKIYASDSYENQEAGAFFAGNYPRWFDRMCFNNEVMINVLRLINKGIEQSKMPQATAGISGGGFTHAETDLEKWIENQKSVFLYSGYQTVSHRANNPSSFLADSIRSATDAYNSWQGYEKSGAPMVSATWAELLCRPSYLPIFSVFSSPPAYYGILKPDLSQNQPDKEMLDSTAKIRNGLADVLNRSRRVFDGAAVIWNFESICANALLGGDSYTRPGKTQTAAMHFIDQLGYRPRYITMNRLMNGKEKFSDYKVLLLARNDAFSDKFAGQIRKFVRNGGTVIADIRPGVFDENLVLRKSGVLDDCFGITRSELGQRNLSTLNMPGTRKMKFELDGKVKTTDGKAFYHSPEGIPAVIVRPMGKGKFVLLNFPFSSLPDFTVPEFNAAGIPAELRSLFNDMKVQWQITRNGKVFNNIRKAEWRSGDLTYLFLHDEKCNIEPYSFTVDLPEKSCVFDVYNSKQYGMVGKISVPVRPPNPALLVIADKPLAALKISVPDNIKRGDSIQVKLAVNGSQQGLRPAVLTFERNGKSYTDYRKTVVISPKEISMPFTIARNESSGKYAFVLTDTLTGKRYKAAFELK